MYLQDELNEQQLRAVQHVDGPLLILAGPGSGKTRVVTHRIGWMLQNGIPGYHILALTFTNKAADEMRKRLDAMFPSNGVWVGTFHRFCAKLLRRHAEFIGLAANYTILDTSDSQALLKRAVQTAPEKLGLFSLSDLASAISNTKSLGVTAEEFEPRPGSAMGEIISTFYPLYQQQLRTANSVDFDDLLLHVATILRESQEIRQHYDDIHRYTMVDEYQDTNAVQYGIVRMLNFDHPNLAVTGDPDQSIYGWRGATIENILNFEKDYPSAEVVRLEVNYRSTPEILAVADEVIQHNVRRKHKRLVPTRESGRPPRIMKRRTQKEEADTIAMELAQRLRLGEIEGKDVAIFYRINALSRSLEKAFRQYDVPYQIVRGVSFYQRKEIKDVLAYLQLLNNPKNDAALLRIINVPARGIGAKTLSKINQIAIDQNVCLLDAARSFEFEQSVSSRARKAVANFVALFDRLSKRIDAPVEEIIEAVIAETHFDDVLAASDESEEAGGENDRVANIRELQDDAGEFDERHGDEPGALEAYLEQVSLVNDVDDWDETCSRVTMMTLHASKGLEFPIVYLVGVEDGMLPHQRSKDNGEIEEERRLFFVGVTRAQQELTLSHVAFRSRRGGLQMAVPSPFFLEISRNNVEWDDRSDLYAGQAFGQSFAGDGEGIDGGFYEEESIQYRQSTGPSGASGTDASDGRIGVVDEGQMPEDGFAPTSEPSDDPVDEDARAKSAKLRQGRRGDNADVLAKLTTAATLLSNGPESSGRPDPNAFRVGVLVEHESHGLGKVTEVGGTGKKRKATVQFFSGEVHKFVVAFSPLRVARADP